MDVYTFNYYSLKCSLCKLPTSSAPSGGLEEVEFPLKPKYRFKCSGHSQLGGTEAPPLL